MSFSGLTLYEIDIFLGFISQKYDSYKKYLLLLFSDVKGTFDQS